MLVCWKDILTFIKTEQNTDAMTIANKSYDIKPADIEKNMTYAAAL